MNDHNQDQPGQKSDALTPEQAAILASAQRTQNELTGNMEHDAAGNPIEPETVKVDPVQENRDLFTMLVAMATPVMPFLPECYTPEVIGNIAGAYTAVEEKYGWKASSLMGPEVALALFAIPPTITAYQLGKAHFAEVKAKREQLQAQQRTETPIDASREHVLGAN